MGYLDGGKDVKAGAAVITLVPLVPGPALQPTQININLLPVLVYTVIQKDINTIKVPKI